MSKNKSKEPESASKGAAPGAVNVEEMSPLERIQHAIDDAPRGEMADWAITILCMATHQTGYRPVFRAAAEQHGEAGIYRLLVIFVQATKPIRHNPLVLAAAQAVASARVQGKGILPKDTPEDLLPAMVITNKVANAAKRGCSLLELETAPLSAAAAEV